MAAKLGTKIVTEYANQLNALWMELDQYMVINAKSSEHSASLRENTKKNRVYDFLVGLNQEYDQVRVPNVGKEEGTKTQ